MRLAISIETAASLYAEPRLEACVRIVDSGMDDLAIVRACVCADHAFRFQDNDVQAAHVERARNGKTYHPCAYYDGVGLEHVPAYQRISRLASISPMLSPLRVQRADDSPGTRSRRI